MIRREMFRKVLIANRGEIACRIIKTCRRLGVSAVAVYSDADAQSLHVRLADEAIALGGSSARESYLAIDKIIAAAKRAGAEAIHPGYGFLSENADFAEGCLEAGIVFIGPPAIAIRAMGSKSAAKALMAKEGVPLTPGYHGDNQDPDFLYEQAEKTGYPVLIKASAGGGGKGMRLVESAANFESALAACKREAAAAFGDDRVLIERYIVRPRHIEIQIFADGYGRVVSLFERDCSVQRRHQKVLEEAPAPGMTAERRAAMGRAACDAARAVGYMGAGTVEFIVGSEGADAQGNFHFMEMNTRLQVEHPVTEMVTGLDLVEWQLRVASGEPLPLAEDALKINGHAIEARIYAEDPDSAFLPSTGQLVHLLMPDQSKHVRIDAGVEQGDVITSFYDPMIAKLIVWDETREVALGRMERALSEIEIAGVITNVDFLKRLITSPSFAGADLDTALIERERDWLAGGNSRNSDPGKWEVPALLAALAVVLGEGDDVHSCGGLYSPWAARDGWRVNGSLQRRLEFVHKEATLEISIEYGPANYRMRVGSKDFVIAGELLSGGKLTATVQGLRLQARVIEIERLYHVFVDGSHYTYKLIDPLAFHADEGAVAGSLVSPLPGRVTALLVQPGELVEQGAPLLVLEAMKMEYTIAAPTAGKVGSFLFAVGDQVPESTQVLQFEPAVKAGS